MKMNDRETDADKVIQVDGSGKRDYKDMDQAWPVALELAKSGQNVLVLVYPGEYPFMQTLELHQNINMRGVPSKTKAQKG